MDINKLKEIEKTLILFMQDSKVNGLIPAHTILVLSQSLSTYLSSIKHKRGDLEKRAERLFNHSCAFNEYLNDIVQENSQYLLLGELGSLIGQASNEEMEESPSLDFESVKKVSLSKNDGYIISFNDGGVANLHYSNEDFSDIAVLIPSHQVSLFSESLNLGPHEEIFTKLDSLINSNIGISQVRNIDGGKFSSHKEYTLDNGEIFILNPHGVLSQDDKYMTFEEFLEEYKSVLCEDAYFEFNKYCVKQDTGGRLINPFNLDVNDINIDDIITALSGINRFAGQTKLLQDDSLGTSDFYTVGQHTLAMYEVIKYAPEKVGLENVSFEEREKMAKQALLHEAFEGITGTDLITPFKYATKKNEYGSVLDKEVLMVGMSQHEVKNKLKELFIAEGLDESLKSYKYEYEKNLGKDLIFKSKLNKYKELLSPLGFDDKTIKIFALQKGKSIVGDDSGVEIILDNNSKIKFSESGARVIRTESETKIDINDFMLKQNLNDIVKLDYEDCKSYMDIDINNGVVKRYEGLKS